MRILFKNKSITLLVFFITGAMLLSACGQKNQEPKAEPQQYQAEQESDKVPDQLKSMEDNVEQIIKALDGPAVVKEEGSKQDKKNEGGGGQEEQEKGKDGAKEEGSKEGSEKGGSEKEGGNKEGEGKQQSENKEEGAKSQEPQQMQPPKPQDPWQTISPLINNLHYQWNGYLPMAAKKGASKQLIDNYSTALNNLTNAIISKNKTNTLLAASSLYSHIPDFYSIYKTETSPEIKRIRYYIRNSMLNAMTANWTQSEADMNSLKSSWSMYKNTVPKEQQDNVSKLDFSILELEKVIKEKNQPLTNIKGRVALSNVQGMEKAAEKEK